jgi:type I restriction enzyme, S subunit
MSEWKDCKLGELANVFSGFAFKSEDLQSEGIPVLKIANIQDKRVLKEVISYFPTEKFKENLDKYCYKSNDILVAMTGEGSVGKFGKMRGVDDTYLVNQRVGIVRPLDNVVDSEYLYQVLTLPQYQEVLYQLGLGAGQPNVSPKHIESIDIPFPPLQTQQKIANILSTYDELIEVNNKRIKILEETAQSIYKEWFVRFRFPNYQNMEFIKGVPKGWEVVRIDTLYKTSSGATPSRDNPQYYENANINWVKTGELNDTFIFETTEKISELGLKKSSAKIFPPYTVIFAMYGNTIGQLGIITESSATNQACCALLPITKYYSYQFIFLTLYFHRNAIISLGMGAAQQNVSQEEIKKYKILKPNKELVSKFDDIISPMFTQIETLQQQNTELRQIRDRILPRLISGKLPV